MARQSQQRASRLQWSDGGNWDLHAERRPLIPRTNTTESLRLGPDSRESTNPHCHLPVYTTIHRIRRDIISAVEDYLSWEQLRDVRINFAVVRPLVDKLYEMDDISTGMCQSFTLRSLA
jgi:hypothetical protein